MINIVPAPIYITTPIALTTLNEDVGKRVSRFIEALARFAVCALVNIANERDFPVPSEPRPVRVAVYGN
jgi:hypothetical protein